LRIVNHVILSSAIAVAVGAPIVGVLACCVGARIPDFDSKIGIPHRTLTHWYPLYLAPALLAYNNVFKNFSWCFHNFCLYSNTILFWFFVGALLHLVEDVVTVQGIPLSLPFGDFDKFRGKGFLTALKQNKRWTLGWTKTGGMFEFVAVCAGLVIAALTEIAKFHT